MDGRATGMVWWHWTLTDSSTHSTYMYDLRLDLHTHVRRFRDETFLDGGVDASAYHRSLRCSHGPVTDCFVAASKAAVRRNSHDQERNSDQESSDHTTATATRHQSWIHCFVASLPSRNSQEAKKQSSKKGATMDHTQFRAHRPQDTVIAKLHSHSTYYR